MPPEFEPSLAALVSASPTARLLILLVFLPQSLRVHIAQTWTSRCGKRKKRQNERLGGGRGEGKQGEEAW